MGGRRLEREVGVRWERPLSLAEQFELDLIGDVLTTETVSDRIKLCLEKRRG